MSLYQPVHAKFERFCRAKAYGSMDYKDLMQESIVIAFQKFEQLQHPDAFLSFLIGISIKVLSNATKKRSESSWKEEFEHLHSQDNVGDRNLEIEDLYRGISSLSETLSESLILFEISGFSIQEIAKIQACSEDSIKQRLVRGRKELAKIMTEINSVQI